MRLPSRCPLACVHLLRRLKVPGRDVEEVRDPRAMHEMSRAGGPRQRLDRLVRYEEFPRRYLGEN